MAESLKSKHVDSPYSLKEIIRKTYQGPFQQSWIDPIKRNENHTIKLETVHQWKVNYVNNVPARQKTTTFRIKVINVDQEKDTRTSYKTSIIIDSLSLDAPCKMRCGSMATYTSKLSHSDMKKKGICPDFYFKHMYVYAKNKILYQRDTTNHLPPRSMNPTEQIGMCKHLATACKFLIETDFFNLVDSKKEYYENIKFVRQLTI